MYMFVRKCQEKQRNSTCSYFIKPKLIKAENAQPMFTQLKLHFGIFDNLTEQLYINVIMFQVLKPLFVMHEVRGIIEDPMCICSIKREDQKPAFNISKTTYNCVQVRFLLCFFFYCFWEVPMQQPQCLFVFLGIFFHIFSSIHLNSNKNTTKNCNCLCDFFLACYSFMFFKHVQRKLNVLASCTTFHLN